MNIEKALTFNLSKGIRNINLPRQVGKSSFLKQLIVYTKYKTGKKIALVVPNSNMSRQWYRYLGITTLDYVCNLHFDNDFIGIKPDYIFSDEVPDVENYLHRCGLLSNFKCGFYTPIHDWPTSRFDTGSIDFSQVGE